MIVNSLYKFIFYFIFLSLLLTQTNESISTETSIVPLQLAPTSKPMLHIGGIQEQNCQRLMGGLQFQPTKNLLIGGIFSPYKIDTNLSIYYHMVLGYIPQWRFFKNSSNMFQVGMDRSRVGPEGDARWFSFSFMESIQFGRLNFNYCWNHLFTQNHEKNTIHISTDLKLSSSLYLRPGVIASFTPHFNYTPFLLISMTI